MDSEKTITIRTDRLILRKWKREDAESMFDHAKDPEVGPVAGWPYHRTISDSEKIIDIFIRSHPYCFAVCQKENENAPIGCIELKTSPCDLTDKDDECELGYWLGKKFWGRGYMTEAVHALISFAFEKLNFSAVWCGYYDGNEKSKRVQEKCGFIYHHTSPNLPVPLLKQTRTGHVSVLTKKRWLENKKRGL